MKREAKAVFAGLPLDLDEHSKADRVDEGQSREIEHEGRRLFPERARELGAERLLATKIELALHSDQYLVELVLNPHRAELRQPLCRAVHLKIGRGHQPSSTNPTPPQDWR